MIQKYLYYLRSIFTLLGGARPIGSVLGLNLLPKPKAPKQIRLRSGVRMKVRSAMDLWSMKETMLDRYYEVFGFPLKEGWQIVDIGAAFGEFSVHAAAFSVKNQVYAFEPNPESFRLLEENLALNQLKNLQTFQVAVWSEDGRVAIDMGSGEALKFTTAETSQGEISPDQLPVEAWSLATLFKNLGLEQVDLLKLDCEGAEYEILMKARPEVLKRVKRIVMEYHDIPEHQHDKLANFLRASGFTVEVFNSIVHDKIGYLRAIQV